MPEFSKPAQINTVSRGSKKFLQEFVTNTMTEK